MAQYKTGTVSVTNGSATVTGSGTLWSGEIAAGDLFTIVGDNAWYEVASVGSNTSITLSANYAGTTGSGKSYAISRDFTTRLALPYPQKGDIETASIIKRAFEQIDTETNIATANYSATSAPTANDDSGDGYSIGSWWVNVTSDEAYLCVDATVGAAVWTKISVDVPSEIVALLAGQSVSMASLTLSGGTANGVLYLNGSKVATSGSGFAFDGTNLAIGTGTFSTIGGQLATLSLGGTNTTVSGGIAYQVNGSVKAFHYVENNILNHQAQSGVSQAFLVNGSEAMRLTSTGLGVGTSSPGYKLDVAGDMRGNSWIGRTNISAPTADAAMYRAADNTIAFSTANTERARIDSSGNLGLGVTPSAWDNNFKALQIGYPNFIAGNNGGNRLDIGVNAYYSGGYKYANTSAATYYSQASGQHQWYTAASGTAGDAITFTQAMTLDASGRLLVGLTSGTSGYNIEAQAGASGTGIRASNSGGGYIAIEAESNATSNGVLRWTNDLKFIEGSTQRMQLSSGNLLVGTTSNTEGARLFVSYPYGTSGGAAPIGTEVDSTLSIRAVSFRNPNGLVGTISTSGSSTAYNTSSDYRLKDNPQPLTGSGAFIDALKPKTWNWKADGSKGVGFIAHEVQEVSPGSVVGEKDGEQMQAMEYGSAEFIANIIAELQSLRARVAALES